MTADPFDRIPDPGAGYAGTVLELPQERRERLAAEPVPPHPGDRSSWPSADELAEMSMHDQEMWERRCADAETSGTSAPRAGEKG